MEIITVILVNVAVGSACYTQLHDMLHSVATMSLHHYNKTSLPSVLGRYLLGLYFTYKLSTVKPRFTAVFGGKETSAVNRGLR